MYCESYEGGIFIKIDVITEENRKLVNQFILDHWYEVVMIIKGERVDISSSDGFCIIDGQTVTGLITYRLKNNICEITLLHTIVQNRGIGRQLVQKVIETVKNNHVDTITVVTTNDNIGAIAFYQKIGFDMVQIYHDSMDYVGKFKPGVPIMGENHIPLRHEIEFFMYL